MKRELVVVCPSCDAKTGDPCRRSWPERPGTVPPPVARVHVARRRLFAKWVAPAGSTGGGDG